ncbi:ERV/ALR sulfhydryl oxidase domain-containing protein [Lineolata rhizophorae]|uniref:Sulfhydryl oxidase n=1 Tax=Lineolata rhizophorae TaxID=578093 RepID=A0A6A6P1G6_9PEZI|nr:ERV/ALR sulfhydryl oxidase domain-containing protein [Lineolata rhizophorae]
MPAATSVEAPQAQDEQQQPQQKLPKGVVLGPDGKPCRSCSSKAAFSAWTAMAKQQSNNPVAPAPGRSSSAAGPASPHPFASAGAAATANADNDDGDDDCPPDVEALGRASWTLLHSITAAYPTRPSPSLQAETRAFLGAFARLYPCWSCGDDFGRWMRAEGGANAPRVASRDEFGRWMCEAHNAVNGKLGKERFDCERWEERWRTGWGDGRCD